MNKMQIHTPVATPQFDVVQSVVRAGAFTMKPRGGRYVDVPPKIFESCGIRVVDDVEMRERLNALFSPVAFWRAIPILRARRLGKIADNHLVPLAQLIEAHTNAIHWKAARRFTAVFKEMLDVVYALRDMQHLNHHYVPVRSAMHLMFGLEMAHCSFIAMRDEWFGGKDKRTLRALVDHYDDPKASFVFSENRKYGYFLRLVHGDEPLRLLGRATMYARQAVGCGNTEAARKLVKSMSEMQDHVDDPVIEFSRLALLRGGINLIRRDIHEERAWVYPPEVLDQLDFNVAMLQRRLRAVVCA